jgi:MarR family 2-MHQ and catechol resistance regulon transcriptional repressor
MTVRRSSNTATSRRTAARRHDATTELAPSQRDVGRPLPEPGIVPGTAHPLEVDAASAVSLKLWVVLSRAQSAVAAHVAADVQRHGLTLTEFAILEALYHRGAMLLGEVQRRILVSSGGITFLVDRLVAKGLVERQACASDRRARYAALTPDGEALLARIFPGHAAAIARAVGTLSPEEQQAAVALLRRLGRGAAALERGVGDSSAAEAAAKGA